MEQKRRSTVTELARCRKKSHPVYEVSILPVWRECKKCIFQISGIVFERRLLRACISVTKHQQIHAIARRAMLCRQPDIERHRGSLTQHGALGSNRFYGICLWLWPMLKPDGVSCIHRNPDYKCPCSGPARLD